MARLTPSTLFFEVPSESQQFGEAMAIYVDSIPAPERHPLAVVRERVEKKKERLFVSSIDGKVVFMALLWPLRNTDFVLLDYIAVKEGYRNRGMGSEFLRKIFELPGVGGKTLVLEVEHPDYGGDRETRRRRVVFYKANGARELKGVLYMLPPLTGTVPTEMILMMLSQNIEDELQGDSVRKIIVQIYWELYGRKSDDPLLNSFIDNVPPKVTLG